MSLLRRFGAIFYDIFLAFSLVFFIGMVIIAIFGDIGNAFLYVVTLPSIYLYFTLSWVKGRQTIGMKAWKFQVIQSNQHAFQPSFKSQNITQQQALIRFLLSFISFILLGFGFIYQWFNKDGICWHDKYSNTLLIKN